MKTISKTDWNMRHCDMKKYENGQHYIKGTDLKYTNGIINSYWIPVKIKGIKQGEQYN